MKRKILLALSILTVSSMSFAATNNQQSIEASLNSIEAKFEQLLKLEEQKKQEFANEKARLEQEVAELTKRLENKEVIYAKLDKDSEVRWLRDDYKKVKNNYQAYYTGIEKSIAQKQNRIEEIRMMLEVMGN